MSKLPFRLFAIVMVMQCEARTSWKEEEKEDKEIDISFRNCFSLLILVSCCSAVIYN